jgi:hypothetical protein
MKQVSLRKLKKMPEFYGELFADSDDAMTWLDRMRSKMGSAYEYGSRSWKAEDNTYLTLAYLHRSE